MVKEVKLRIPVPLHRRAKALAAMRGVTLNELMKDAIEKHVRSLTRGTK
jgi:predicted HicB family RNase H-like nuclease